MSDQLGPARWRLYRLDDNGNEFPMEYLHSNASAEYLRKKYEDKGHKQLYFIRPIFDSPDSPQRKQDASP
ncbi:hypothetical protein [Lysobacter capsici]|uniref:hypothetical protein n=1 Tax=Lysobacter capsici TaxID=435897 RepID=UPI001C003FE6|nr:hypothetical protein [Lysobacter capsici]QWF17182.1 hypothetical protein KME82_26235 [Lysobacter capsici]